MTIADLYRKFEKARAAARAMPESAKFDRAAARLGDMAARIAKAPAKTLDEMLAKIDAALAEGSYTEHRECLETLREDLRRLQAH